MNPNEQVLIALEKKLQSAAPKALPWMAIITALMQLFGGCLPQDPRPQAKSPGPFLRLKMRKNLRQQGVAPTDLDVASDLAFKVAADATKKEVEDFRAVTQEVLTWNL